MPEKGVESQRQVVGRKGWNQRHVVGRKGWNHRGRWLGGRGGITEAEVEEVESQRQEERKGWNHKVVVERKGWNHRTVTGRKGWNHRGR